jgi:hypothetical protein
LLPQNFALEYMMQRCDQLLTQAMLLGVWNYKFVPATNRGVHMGRLRPGGRRERDTDDPMSAAPGLSCDADRCRAGPTAGGASA